MMDVLRLFPTNEAEWDCHFDGLDEAGLCQSYFYARVMERINRDEPVFVRVLDGGYDIAYCLMLRKDLTNSDNSDTCVRRRKRLFSCVGGSLECLDGPVIITQREADSRKAIACLLDWVENYCTENRIKAIRWLGMSRTSPWIANDSLALAFLCRGYEKSSWATLLVDLKQDEDLLWRSLNRAARKCIRKCREQDVYVEQINGFEDFRHSFYAPYAKAQAAYGRQASPLLVFQIMFEEDTSRRYAYFVAKDSSGETLATLGVYCFGKIATEIASMLLPKAREQGIPAQDLLHWEVLKWAKAKGCDAYDVAGISPQARNSKEVGVRRFKEKWGGRYVEYHRFEKMHGMERFRRAAGSLAHRIKYSLENWMPH